MEHAGVMGRDHVMALVDAYADRAISDDRDKPGHGVFEPVPFEIVRERCYT